MKYIKLFEAFESQVITSTIKFLTKKIDQKTSNLFSDDIRRLMNDYNIPISKISEDDVKYYRSKKAVKIKNTKSIENDIDIYCIKYWFSLEKGFLGKTAVGNLRTPYVKLINNYHEKNKDFSEEQLDYIKNSLDINSGKLTSVLDYGNLKDGDYVLLTFGDRSSDELSISIGRIFNDISSGGLYVYNDFRSDGVSPDSSPSFSVDYEKTWRLGRNNSNGFDVDGDHFKLHVYTKDNKPLRQETKKEEKHKHKPNLADYNKPLDDGKISDWTMRNQNNIKDVIEESDFAIIVYLDRLLKLPSTNLINNVRKEARKGATALMSNDEIKRININNYTKGLVKKYGIDKYVEDFSKLNKLVDSIMGNKFIMFNIFVGNLNAMDSIINSLYSLINEDYDKEYYFNDLLSTFKNVRNQTKRYNLQYNKNLDLIYKSGDDNLITIVERTEKIGQDISNYINTIVIENIHDLIIIKHKILAIQSFIMDYKNRLPSCYRDIISNLETSNIKAYIEYCDGVDDQFDDSMNKLDIMEKFVNSILK